MNFCARCGADISKHGYFMFFRKKGIRAMFDICVKCHDELRKERKK